MKPMGPLRIALSAALSCLSSACMVSERRAEPSTIAADDVLAATRGTAVGKLIPSRRILTTGH